jgi:hypothetical protein
MAWRGSRQAMGELDRFSGVKASGLAPRCLPGLPPDLCLTWGCGRREVRTPDHLPVRRESQFGKAAGMLPRMGATVRAGACRDRRPRASEKSRRICRTASRSTGVVVLAAEVRVIHPRRVRPWTYRSSR